MVCCNLLNDVFKLHLFPDVKMMQLKHMEESAEDVDGRRRVLTERIVQYFEGCEKTRILSAD